MVVDGPIYNNTNSFCYAYCLINSLEQLLKDKCVKTVADALGGVILPEIKELKKRRFK